VQRMLLLSTTVNYIRTRFAHLRAHEDGVTAVEYALMVAIIALLMVAGFFLLFDNIKTAFDNTADCVEDPATATATCGSVAGG
jgi:Flp pilus assembly pilin Flp